MKAITALTLFAGLFVIAGCGETASETPTTEAPAADSGGETTVVAAVNEMCPIMGSEVTDDGGRSEWEGQTVGFCCPGCIKKWEALSADDKKTKLASSMKADTKGAAMGTNGAQFVSLTKSSESCCSGSKTAGKEGTCCSEGSTKASCCASTTAKAGSCCADSKTVGTTAVASNANCPIMGSPVKAGGGSAEWDGKTIGFCCPGCVKKWDALSADEKAQKLTDATAVDTKAGA